MWLEIVTLLIPGFNDDVTELRDLTRFIAGVSPDIPWHITAFHRDYKMTGPADTTPNMLRRAAAIGAKLGCGSCMPVTSPDGWATSSTPSARTAGPDSSNGTGIAYWGNALSEKDGVPGATPKSRTLGCGRRHADRHASGPPLALLELEQRSCAGLQPCDAAAPTAPGGRLIPENAGSVPRPREVGPSGPHRRAE